MTEDLKQAPDEFPNEVATANDARSRSRRIVRTPDGLFLIRRIRSLDYLLGKTPITIPAAMTKRRLTEEQIKEFAARQGEETTSSEAKREEWLRVMYEQGTVSECVYYMLDEQGKKVWTVDETPGSSAVRTSRLVLSHEPIEHEISAFAVDDKTLAILLSEIMQFGGFTARADIEGQLDGFRSEVDRDSRPAGSEVQQTP